ncbi:hypothetical protein Tco_1124992 [Tanacetum coccineum]|uniref:Uncharacterized protein n=1 Tax=Tanacetum coccineum TaxID=301880 RepID=A0ABQ5J7Q1_9ASTR
MADASHLLEDPTFMALNPLEMVEYLERLNLSDSPPSPARANLLSGLRRMFENNAPLSQVCLVLLDILTDFHQQQEEEAHQQQQGEGEEEQRGNNGKNGGEKQEGNNDETGGEKQEEGDNDETGGS